MLQITVHESRVVQIEKKAKVHLDKGDSKELLVP